MSDNQDQLATPPKDPTHSPQVPQEAQKEDPRHPKGKRDNFKETTPTKYRMVLRRPPKKLSLNQKVAIKARLEMGDSPTQIALDEGISRSTVHDVKNDGRVRIIPRERVEQYKSALMGLVYENAWRATVSVSDAKLEKSSALQLTTIAAINIEKGRLMEEKSTQNVSHRGLMESIAGEMEKLKSIAEKLED